MYCAWQFGRYHRASRLACGLWLPAKSQTAHRRENQRRSIDIWAIIPRWPRLPTRAILCIQFVFASGIARAVEFLVAQSARHRALDTIDDDIRGELLVLRQALQASGEAILLTDRNGIISYVNPEFTRLYGYDSEEVVGISTPRVLKSGMMTEQAYVGFWKTLLRKQIFKGEIINRCKDGRLVTVESTANAIVNHAGEIIGFLAIQRDITERKSAERELRQRNRELAILNTVANAVSRSLEIEQVLDDALAEVLQLDIFGTDAKGMVFLLDEKQGHLFLVANRGAPEDHPCIRTPVALGECLCGLAALHGQMIVSDESQHDQRHSRCPAVASHRDICLPLKARGRVVGVMTLRLPAEFAVGESDRELLRSVADQIAMAVENARLFEAISRQRRHLKAMAARSAEMEEAERRRLSRELHDQVGQNLSAIGLNLTIIRTLMAQNEPAAAHLRLNDTQALVEHVTEQIRGLMVELRPPILDDYGLLAALDWYANQTFERTGLPVRVNGDDRDQRLRPSAEIALFRIAQEALSNVVKHARTTEATITLKVEDDSIHLVIEDDGLGFDAQHGEGPQPGSGWGRFIMAERAEALGGHCHIESDPVHGGTVVFAEVPR